MQANNNCKTAGDLEDVMDGISHTATGESSDTGEPVEVMPTLEKTAEAGGGEKSAGEDSDGQGSKSSNSGSSSNSSGSRGRKRGSKRSSSSSSSGSSSSDGDKGDQTYPMAQPTV